MNKNIKRQLLLIILLVGNMISAFSQVEINDSKLQATENESEIQEKDMSQQSGKSKDKALSSVNIKYITRNFPQIYAKFAQNRTNVWLKDATNWLQKKTDALYEEPFSAEPETEEINIIVLNQVFQHNKARLESLLKTEPPLVYKCLIDKSGYIIEVMFDLAPKSKLRFEDLQKIEMALKQFVRFSNFNFLNKDDTLENIKAKYLLHSDYIEFKKIASFDMSTL